MPRNSPSTEFAPGGGTVRPKDAPGVASIEIEVIDLGAGRPVTIARRPIDEARPPRGWLVWLVVAAVLTGLAFFPEDSSAPPVTTAPQLLPTPDVATTSTTLAATSVALMSDDSFPLTPASGLEDFVQLVGPVEFNGKHWIIGNHSYPSAAATVLSSVDGTTWETEASVSVDGGEWLRIDDLDAFEGVLMAVGAVGQDQGPAYAPPTPSSSVLWKSIDGRRWSSLPISSDGGSPSLQLTAGSEAVLITEYPGAAIDLSNLNQIPLDLVPGLERGDFLLSFAPGGYTVVAPPGIELFRLRAFEQNLTASSMKLFRSENLIIWEKLPINFSVGNLTTTPDGGFLAQDYGLRYSSDGRTWEQTDRFPPRTYQNWDGRLLGVDRFFGTTRLLVVEGEEYATIELPSEISRTNLETFITAGDSGLAAVVADYGAYAEPITRIDGYTLALEGGTLRIEEPSGETSYAYFDNNGLIEGSYLPDTDSIRFEANETKTFEFPAPVLRDLGTSPQTFRFDVFLSADGLSWARPQAGLRAGYVAALGSVNGSFLVALQNYDTGYRQLPVTVYRTGPVG